MKTRPTRILLVGSDYVWSIERFYQRYLAEPGLSVPLFAAQNRFYSYYQHSIWNKLVFRAGLSRIYHRINRELIRETEAFRPDLIWVFKGMEVLPSTLRHFRNQGIKLVNFNGDNPFIFSGSGSGNSNVARALSLYDLHLTYNLEIRDRLDRENKLRTGLLPFGFDCPDDIYQAVCGQEEVKRLCFLGNPDRPRIAAIRGLAEKGVPVDVYGGPDWAELTGLPGIGVFPPVYGEEFWRTLRRYRVQLNLMRPHNENSHNMRSFEIPGIGGIMLAPDTVEHRLFFTDGQEAFFFTGGEDAAEKAHHILSLNDRQAGAIRAAARERSLRDGYTYRQRALFALEQMQQLYA